MFLASVKNWCFFYIWRQAMAKQIKIYSPVSSVVHLVKDKKSPASTQKQVTKFVDYFKKEKIKTVHTLKSSNFKELTSYFFSEYQVVIACGGIVVNEYNELLLIQRRGYWDLPKGKLEKGEKKKICAIREVEEECGISKLKIKSKLKLDYNQKNITYHTYRFKSKPTIKPSYWYLMETKKQPLIPQTEEDITKAKWVKLKDIPNYYSASYPAIVDVLRSAILQLGQ